MSSDNIERQKFDILFERQLKDLVDKWMKYGQRVMGLSDSTMRRVICHQLKKMRNDVQKRPKRRYD